MTNDDTVTVSYTDRTLPYPYAQSDELELVAVSIIGRTNYLSYAGSVYLYDAESGKKIHTIHNPEPNLGVNFGRHVDIHGTVLTVRTSDTGSTHIYNLESGKYLLNSQP